MTDECFLDTNEYLNVELMLINFTGLLMIRGIIDSIKVLGYRPAIASELLAFNEIFCVEDLIGFGIETLVALGSKSNKNDALYCILARLPPDGFWYIEPLDFLSNYRNGEGGWFLVAIIK